MDVEFDPRSNFRLANILETVVEENVCAEIEGLSINAPDETTGVTSFSSEAGVCASIPVEPVVSFAKGEESYQDLKEYFRRPRLIFADICRNTVTSLVSRNVTANDLFTDWFPNGYSRLAGVQGVRFDMVFTTTVAANPFHGGLLATCFQYDGHTTDTLQFCRVISPITSTHLPHVRLDIAENTMTMFTVPWLYPIDYLPLDSSSTGTILGAFGLEQVIPTPTLASSPAPTFRVFVHLENLELIGSRPMVEQFVVAQSGGRVSKPTQSKATVNEMHNTGVLSGVLDKVSNAATMLNDVPLLSTVAGPAAWVAGLAGNVASIFGFSKPRDRSMPVRHFRTDYVGEGNTDMPNSAFTLAITADNQLTVDSTLGGTDVDEMSLRYVLSKWSQLCLFNMTTADTTSTVLYSGNTCLMNYWYRSGTTKPFSNIAPPFNSATENCFFPTNLMYWAQFFKMWNGTLKYRFTFGKSKFHAGRVIAAFTPYARQVGRTTRNIDQVPAIERSGAANLPQPFSYTKVFDLKDSSSFEFEVPYLSPYLWTGINGYTGGITLTVLDTLIANGECATAIPVLLEVCAGDDFEFAQPAAPTMVPVTGSIDLVPRLQSGGTLGVKNQNVHEYTSGEVVKSVKQIIMCPVAITADIGPVQQFFTVHPPFPYVPAFTNATPMPLNVARWQTSSKPGIASACYAYYNGSTSYHIYNDKTSRSAMYFYINGIDQGSATPTLNSVYSAQNSTLNNHRVNTGNNSLHVEVPPYTFYPRQSIRRIYNPATTNYFPNNSGFHQADNNLSQPVSLVRNLDTVLSNRVVWAMAAADDARLAAFIGPPPVYLFNPLSTARIEGSPATG